MQAKTWHYKLVIALLAARQYISIHVIICTNSFILAIERLKRQKSQLEKSCQNLMFRLREADKEVDRDELQRELERKRLRQAQLEKHVQSLEKQRKRLSVTRRVVCELHV